MGKPSLLKKETKEHLKGQMGQAKRGTSARMMRYNVFKRELLHRHLGRHGRRVLIDSCKLHNRLYCACLPHTRGHSCALRKHVVGQEKSLWLVCVHCALGHIGWVELEKFLWLFCSISVNSSQPYQACQLGFRVQLETFSARPLLCCSCLTFYLTVHFI